MYVKKKKRFFLFAFISALAKWSGLSPKRRRSKKVFSVCTALNLLGNMFIPVLEK